MISEQINNIKIIRPSSTFQFFDINEILHYRDLLYFMIMRDLRVRYKQTILGGLWVILQPLLFMLLFTFFFGKLAKISSDGIPYPIFNFSALVVWIYFSNAITLSSNSLINNINLVSKVYFPRIIIPMSPIVAGLVDFSIAFVLLIGMMIYYHIYPTIMIFFVPVFLLITVMTASGIGMLLSALCVKYRDIKFTIPFLVQFWMYASPIVYPTSMVPQKYQFLYALNPMVGVIEGMRSVLLGSIEFPARIIIVSVIMSIVILFLGLFYFKKVERFFADII